jgi:D-alanyl-lipoteichoic acid acyltransferase DltB (MBOAT superfamily)
MIFILAGRLTMRWLGGGPREVIFALLNLAGVYFFLFGATQYLLLLEYILMIVLQYVLLRVTSDSKGWLPWLAFFCPIIFLIAVRYIPDRHWSDITALAQHLTGHWFPAPYVVGISYMAFRCSRLVLEVRTGSVKKPGFFQYLGFAFFLPTMFLGPINTYANFRRGFEATHWDVPIGRATLRILVGAIKYLFIGGVLWQLTYVPFLLNGHPHHWIDLPIAMIFYYLYLYCNFSGFCDMAIGVAALIGIPVLENFDNPFAARNIKEFWSRWHITLSQWMRDIVFAPLSKFLVRVMGPANANHAVALAILVVFLLIGIWHGVGWHYAIFGAIQAIGVAANHYYTIALKKRLGREGFKAYNENRWIHAVAVVSTFLFYAASLFFFANSSLHQMKEILRVLR